MNRPATWKVVTVGAALTGLGMVGAGTAAAATVPVVAPTAITAPLYIDAVTGDVPASFVALDDDWTETYWDDDRNGDRQGADDWTETYWDD
jgi:hypothetical protein